MTWISNIAKIDQRKLKIYYWMMWSKSGRTLGAIKIEKTWEAGNQENVG